MTLTPAMRALDKALLLFIITIMPKKVDHTARRLDLTEVAIDVIGERGLEGARLADIARAAGATTGTIVHYFEDKDALLIAALERVVARLKAHFDDLDPGRSDLDHLIELLSECLPLDDESRRDWRVWLIYWGRVLMHDGMARIHNDYYASFEGMLCEIIRGFQKSGALARELDAGEAANFVMAVVDGLGIRAAIDPERWPAARQKRDFRAMLSRYFGLCA